MCMLATKVCLHLSLRFMISCDKQACVVNVGNFVGYGFVE